MTILYEVTISVSGFSVKMLFQSPPELIRVCEAIRTVFANNKDVRDGLIDLIHKLPPEAELSVGGEIRITDNDAPVGAMDLQTRTLFE